MPDREPPFDDPENRRLRSSPLPPELDPRGRRTARAEARRRAATEQSIAELGAGTGPRAGVSGPRRSSTRPSAAARRRSLLFGASVTVKVIAAGLSLTILAYSYFYWDTYRKAQANVAVAAPLPSESSGHVDIDGKAQNILLLGNDSRTGATPAELQALATTNDGGSANTDTMMVMHIPADGSKATVLSFPRDSYVDIPGYGSDKLNAAYPDAYNKAKQQGASDTDASGAGVALLALTLENLTGLHIDHYVQITLLGFYRISNAIGGVPVLLCQAQKEPKSGINLPAGLSTIEGTQALAFVRQRYDLPNGDLDRIKRQQYFLSSVFSSLISSGTLLDISKINRLLTAVSSSLLTDGLNLLSLASDFAQMSSGNLTFATIPTDGFGTENGESVLVVDPDEVKASVDKDLGIAADPAYASAGTVAPGSVTVSVLNASGQNGAATRGVAALQQLGFTASIDTGSGSSATTKIEYPNGMQAQAKTLAAKVPGATPELTSSVSTVTLVLGADGIGVGVAATAPASGSASVTPAASSVAGAKGGVPSVPNQAGCIN